MKDEIILVVLAILILYMATKPFDFRIEAIKIAPNKFKVILWYNSFVDGDIYRKFIKIF